MSDKFDVRTVNTQTHFIPDDESSQSGLYTLMVDQAEGMIGDMADYWGEHDLAEGYALASQEFTRVAKESVAGTNPIVQATVGSLVGTGNVAMSLPIGMDHWALSSMDALAEGGPVQGLTTFATIPIEGFKDAAIFVRDRLNAWGNGDLAKMNEFEIGLDVTATLGTAALLVWGLRSVGRGMGNAAKAIAKTVEGFRPTPALAFATGGVDAFTGPASAAVAGGPPILRPIGIGIWAMSSGKKPPDGGEGKVIDFEEAKAKLQGGETNGAATPKPAVPSGFSEIAAQALESKDPTPVISFLIQTYGDAGLDALIKAKGPEGYRSLIPALFKLGDIAGIKRAYNADPITTVRELVNLSDTRRVDAILKELDPQPLVKGARETNNGPNNVASLYSLYRRGRNEGVKGILQQLDVSHYRSMIFGSTSLPFSVLVWLAEIGNESALKILREADVSKISQRAALASPYLEVLLGMKRLGIEKAGPALKSVDPSRFGRMVVEKGAYSHYFRCLMELVLAENKIAQLIFTELVRDERIPDYALWDIYLGKYPKQLLEALARAGKFKFMESLASRNITIMIPEGETRATYKAPWEIAWQTADLTPVVEAVQSGNLDAQTLLSDIEHRSWLIGDNPTLPIR